MRKIVVFDFDKTLTDIDTTLPFFAFCSKGSRLRLFFLNIYYLLKILSKFKIISVKKEKEIGLLLFCPRDINEFKRLCYQFSKTISLNDIYFNEYKKYTSGNRCSR